MKKRNLIIFSLLLLMAAGFMKDLKAQSDSLYFKEIDLKRIGVNFYNLSKADKFNFEVVVLGGVKNPGIYLLPDGTSLVELVALTGGSIDESIYDEFKLLRSKSRNPNLLADTVMVISYKDFFDKDKKGSISKQNPLLKPGDIISFPIKPDKDFWETAQKVSSIFIIPLITLASLIINIMVLNK